MLHPVHSTARYLNEVLMIIKIQLKRWREAGRNMKSCTWKVSRPRQQRTNHNQLTHQLAQGEQEAINNAVTENARAGKVKGQMFRARMLLLSTLASQGLQLYSRFYQKIIVNLIWKKSEEQDTQTHWNPADCQPQSGFSTHTQWTSNGNSELSSY